jgi:hypothetical protein
VTIAIDGGGVVQFKFRVGSLTGLSFGVGPLAPITIEEATSSSLRAGKCSNNWFRATIDEPASNPFLVVEIITPGNASCNFFPDGLAGYHIDPGKDEILTYSRSKEGNLEVRTESSKR